MLKEDQLQSAIGVLENEVEGLDASMRLDKAVIILQEIADKHYQTKAGRAAIAGLTAINQSRHIGVLAQPTLVPNAEQPKPAEPTKPTPAAPFDRGRSAPPAR